MIINKLQQYSNYSTINMNNQGLDFIDQPQFINLFTPTNNNNGGVIKTPTIKITNNIILNNINNLKANLQTFLKSLKVNPALNSGYFSYQNPQNVITTVPFPRFS
jgi:hypothetical protein